LTAKKLPTQRAGAKALSPAFLSAEASINYFEEKGQREFCPAEILKK